MHWPGAESGKFGGLMPRTLKTFVTSVGFFDLAVATPSMKAALDAWGFRHNAFQQGFASETGDTKIIKAATARPGVVLRRPVGTSEPFAEEAELPKGFSLPKMGSAPQAVGRKTARSVKTKRPAGSKSEDEASKASILSFKAEKAKRDQRRAKEEAAAGRERERRRLALSKAQDQLEDARRQHEGSLESLKQERAQLDARVRREEERWDRLRGKLDAAVDRARD
jgi:hypothetical protein